MKIAAGRLPAGVSVRLDRRGRAVAATVDPALAEPAAAIRFLYGLLNAYERAWSVFIEGLPPCALPDAWDHFPPRTSGRRVAACRGCRLRGACPGVPPAFPRAGPWAALPAALPEAPREVVFEVNRRCNLACTVCASRHLAAELPLKTILEQLAAARRAGVATARFTGGEPFLHPHLLSALRAAKEAGFAVLVNTNATLLDAAAVNRAAPYMDNVLVSLQASDAAGEAAATGVPGLFARKLAALRLLRRAVPVLRLGTVITPRLLEDFDGCLRLARRLGADAWELYRPMAAAASPEITPAALGRLAARLEREAGRPPLTVFANPVPFCLFPRRQAPLFLGARFDDGHTRLVLDPRGFWKPSYYLQAPLGADLLRAWRSPGRRALAAAPAACRGCLFLPRCLGGSRALAAQAGLRHDPWLKRGLTAPFK